MLVCQSALGWDRMRVSNTLLLGRYTLDAGLSVSTVMGQDEGE